MIPFNDLQRQNAGVESDLRDALARVIDSGWYILGAEVEGFEREFADYLDASHCVGVASGTDAVQLALMAIGVGSGDEVITAANTCVPTVSAIVSSGATPVLADVDPATLTLDAASVERAITPRTRAVVPVHLYGHSCDLDAIAAVTSPRDIAIVEDCAQAHGAQYRGRNCGTLGAAAAFSFYPTKNLGAIGDGGAVVTDDPGIAQRLRALRQYGRTEAYDHPRFGINSRLDEMQAAVLRVKLPHLDAWNEMRNVLAARYRDGIRNECIEPIVPYDWATPNYHLFVVRTPYRDALQTHLREKDIAAQIHYPAPIHSLEAYRSLGEPGAFPVAEQACREVLSLPLYPGITEHDVDAVIDAVNGFRP